MKRQGIGMGDPTFFHIALLLSFLLACLVSGRTLAAETNIDVQRFKPSPFPEDLYNVNLGDTRGVAPRGNVGLFVHYQNDPLVQRQDDRIVRKVLEHQLVGDVIGAMSVTEWLDLGLALPIIFYQEGKGFPTEGEPATLGIGDFRVHLKARLFKTDNDVFAIGFAPVVTFPLGKQIDQFAGSEGVTGGPLLAASLSFNRAGLALNLGYTFSVEERTERMNLSDELLLRLGGWFWLYKKKLNLTAEIVTATTMVDPFGDASKTPTEIVAGIRAYPASWMRIDWGCGFGVTAGYATPDFRLFAGITVSIPSREEKPPPPADSDGDAIADADDKCPAQPEDVDEFEDKDGCPDADNDGDLIRDEKDKCPLDAEDKDQFEDEDGCPDADNDGDGFQDNIDKCTLDAEDEDGFQDEDGCPDPDNDLDKLCDPWVSKTPGAAQKHAVFCSASDACPDQAETVNDFDDHDGCPDEKTTAEDEQKEDQKKSEPRDPDSH